MKFMTINTSDLYVRPLFYDALSGEFLPPSVEVHYMSATSAACSLAVYSSGVK